MPSFVGCQNHPPHEAPRAPRRHHGRGQRGGGHPVRHRGARPRGDGAERARRGADGELHLHLHERPRRGVPRRGRAHHGPLGGAAPVRPRDRGAGRAAARDQAAPPLLHGPGGRTEARVSEGSGVAQARPPGRPVTGLEFNERVGAIPVYPAASTYAFDGELVKLASNEPPFAPHPQVLEAVEAQLRTLNRYPDPAKSALRSRLSDRTGTAPERVAIGNGSCELLLAGADAMLEPGAEVVYAWPSFSIYPHLAAMTGG